MSRPPRTQIQTLEIAADLIPSLSNYANTDKDPIPQKHAYAKRRQDHGRHLGEQTARSMDRDR